MGIMPNGYGKLKEFTVTWRAHRYAWTLYRGPIPVDMLILHKCDVKCCVNPDHLYVGTTGDNTVDAVSRKPRDMSWLKEVNNICKYGHELTGKNVGRDRNGYRYCMRCSSARASNAYYKRRYKCSTEA
jgi:hypothetical protein